MSSRADILTRVAKNKPQLVAAPDISGLGDQQTDADYHLSRFCEVAAGIGALVISINSLQTVKDYIVSEISEGQRAVTSIPELIELAEDGSLLIEAIPHDLQNVELAIIRAEFGVAENGALWVTAAQMGTRVLPFITQHLAIIVRSTDILPDLHAAYKRTAGSDNDFAAFIAGPSKTADIEQSLVLGAHGSRSLVVFVLNEPGTIES